MKASHAFKARLWSCLLLSVAVVVVLLAVTNWSQVKAGLSTDAVKSGTDVLVNDPSGDYGPSKTQAETNLAINETTGVLCSAYDDFFHYFVDGTGNIGFSSSNDAGATWIDHGVIPGGDGYKALIEPSIAWRRLDGHFYLVSGTYITDFGNLNGLGLWDLGTDCSSATWIKLVMSGVDDTEMLSIDNNPSSPYYGRMYIAFMTDVNFQLYAIHSDDRVTWTTPFVLSSHGVNVHPTTAVDPVNHNLYITWTHVDIIITPPTPIEYPLVRSIDGGVTFTNLQSAGSNLTYPYVDGPSIYCGIPALNGNFRLFVRAQIAVDSDSNLHIVYSYDPDGHNVGDVSDIFYRRSIDEGESWGPEMRLNDDSTLNDQFMPAITIAPNGNIGVFWYDRRLDPNNMLYDYFGTVSFDGGVTFEGNQRFSDVSSPVKIDANIPYVCYHGEYNGSAADVNRFYVEWADDRNGNTDVFMDTSPGNLEGISGLQVESNSPSFIGETSLFTATIANGTYVKYEWNFGDGEAGSGPTVEHTYAQVGDYTAIITASNSISSESANITVAIRDIPISGLVAINDGPTTIGKSTVLSASVTGGTGVIYSWEFGDGTAATGQEVSHIYQNIAIYTATVTATNTSGSVIATTEVKIVPYRVYIPITNK